MLIQATFNSSRRGTRRARTALPMVLEDLEGRVLLSGAHHHGVAHHPAAVNGAPALPVARSMCASVMVWSCQVPITHRVGTPPPQRTEPSSSRAAMRPTSCSAPPGVPTMIREPPESAASSGLA